MPANKHDPQRETKKDREERSQLRQKTDQAVDWVKASLKPPDIWAQGVGEGLKQAGVPADAFGPQTRDMVELVQQNSPYLRNKGHLYLDQQTAAAHKPVMAPNETGIRVNHAALTENKMRDKLNKGKQFEQAQQKGQGRSMRRS